MTYLGLFLVDIYSFDPRGEYERKIPNRTQIVLDGDIKDCSTKRLSPYLACAYSGSWILKYQAWLSRIN